ncbi:MULTISPECIES: isochorismatase family protein [Serratia]|uniref:Nicotinamidase-related amidase n=1 Tax=Serratia nematodiphila TaxID=458197 RepID=A0A1G5ATX8_9GAMM|nr:MULTISPECIES: isochorismatase family protein [Serratia]ANM80403.1 endoribonuclease L-PSP family protein [Serratia marcescens]MDP8823332.1 isochorismatase family protein [Serratia marcescens]MDT0208158.1 isochorismatase family protein [Serratia marcescens]UTO03184.1 isochorismatase family protein [Serratia nematodiphila]CAI1581788.1 Peroxyureidoacrylate/ureidoacrylate amidohydrolase RutB [Serratia marcescens]
MLKFTNGLFSRLCLLSTMAVTASQAAAAATNLIPQQQPKEERAALVMIEFVNEWLDPQGKLHGLIQDKRSLARSQEAGKRALEAARQAGMPVIHATLQLSPDYRELGRKPFGLRGAIPKAGTWQKQDKGWQFYPSFAPRSNEFVISGRAGASAFAASDLDNYLRGQGITRLYLAGYATHVCIESTLRAAHDLGYEPVILSDATAAFTAQQQQHVLNDVVHHFGWAMMTQAFIETLSFGDQTALKARSTNSPEPAQSLRLLTAPGQKIPGVSGAAQTQSGLLFLSGHVPVTADNKVPLGLEKQLELAFKNLNDTLQHAGSSPENIVRMTLYVRNYRPEQLATIRKIRDRWLKGHEPASALIGVETLFRQDVLVEIDAVAVPTAPQTAV